MDLPTKDSNKVSKREEDIEEKKPPFETTTLWDYPKQSYGEKPKGDNKFQGVTPAFIILETLQIGNGRLVKRSRVRKRMKKARVLLDFLQIFARWDIE